MKTSISTALVLVLVLLVTSRSLHYQLADPGDVGEVAEVADPGDVGEVAEERSEPHLSRECLPPPPRRGKP